MHSDSTAMRFAASPHSASLARTYIIAQGLRQQKQQSNASIVLYVCTYKENGDILHSCVTNALDGTSVSISTVTHIQTVLPIVEQYG